MRPRLVRTVAVLVPFQLAEPNLISVPLLQRWWACVSKELTQIVGTTLVLLAIPGLPNLAFACSCMWAGPFAKVALGKELIVLGEVMDHYKNSMEVQIIEVVKGTEERKTIRIWGDNGALCRPYVAHFPIGTRWLLAVFPLPEKTGETRSPWQGFASPPGRREYTISVCGDFWLEVRGETAIGRITVNDYSNFLEWVPLGDMLAWLRSNGKSPMLSPTPLSTSSR